MQMLRIIVLLSCILLSLYSSAQSNDHIFPAANVAKSFIDFDSKGFIINGKRTFIVSAGMEYARVPRALWKDRLQRLRAAGFNCIEIYTFWNYHEPQEGKFNFSGDHDLNAFLQLVHSLGMYAIVRVGPYYCAEWDFGGYPTWLKFKKGLKVREPNKAFETCVDHFFDTLMPVVSRNQINHGGAVVMVQLENEHPLGWGTAMPNSYFEHLRSYAVSKGLQVPYFFSGLHHSSDPAGNEYKLDDDKRPNPWFSTEFWSVWYNAYSSGEKEAKLYEGRTWKIIAGGGNGYNYYMAHGGSNFGYTNNDEDAASYDYGAAVGQAGDLRPIYYTMKRAAFFARSFEDILENSTNAISQYTSLLKDTAIRLSARTSPAGDIVFLDNQTDKQTQVNFMGKTILVEEGEIYPLVHEYRITPDVIIHWSFARIYALYKQGNTTNIIVNGNAAEEAIIDFSIKTNAVVNTKEKVFHVTTGIVEFKANILRVNQPQSYSFTCGAQTIRIICLSNKLADRTWLFLKGNQSYMVSGPAYVSDIKEAGNNIRISAEKPWQSDTSSAWLFTQKEMIKLNQSSSSGTSHLTNPSLSPWQYQTAMHQAAIDYDDQQWLQSRNPMQMGADGDTTADAWYRTTINIPKDGMYTLQADGGGRATTFIDEKPMNAWNISDGGTTLSLTKGKHLMSFFTAHDGRDKLAAYIGAIDSTDSKGLYGDVRLLPGNNAVQTLQGWRYLIMPDKEAVNKAIPADTSPWKPYKIGDDVFDKKKGFAWFQTRLPLEDYKGGTAVLFFKSVDENATVFINNQLVAKHEGWNQKFYVTLTHLDTLKTPVYLNVFIENYDNEGGIDQPVKLNIIPNNTIPVTGWRMKGGTGNPDSDKWSLLNDTGKIAGPCFYQSAFTLDVSALKGTIWRVQTTGLGHGSVWINGYNLGRYPEKIPAPGMYIPDCWLHKGSNKIVIYEEDSKSPQKVGLQTEAAASRDLIQLTTHISDHE